MRERILLLYCFLSVLSQHMHKRKAVLSPSCRVCQAIQSRRTACISSHNCFDVDLLNIPHVICDSGCSGGGGGGGTSSNFGAAFPTAGARPSAYRMARVWSRSRLAKRLRRHHCR